MVPYLAMALIYIALVMIIASLIKVWKGGSERVIDVINLKKSYGDLEVLKGITVSIKEGEKLPS